MTVSDAAWAAVIAYLERNNLRLVVPITGPARIEPKE